MKSVSYMDANESGTNASLFKITISDTRHHRRTSFISAVSILLLPTVFQTNEPAAATCGACVGAFQPPTNSRLTLFVPHQDAQPSFACNTTWPGGL
jgi:hypothetical protein